MATPTRHIPIDAASELGQALRAAHGAGEHIVLERDGRSYELRPCGGNGDIWENYDPERVREMLARTAGALQGVDTERLKRELREQRGHRVPHRPACGPRSLSSSPTSPFSRSRVVSLTVAPGFGSISAPQGDAYALVPSI